jgi:hypothetical protein
MPRRRPTTSSSSVADQPANLADIVVRGGLSAVLVEAELVGSDCSYSACIPRNALLRGPRCSVRRAPSAAPAPP